MADDSDAYQYFGFLGRHWRFIALACSVALAGAATLSLLGPRQYTATARILIEPPAGADPRSAMAVSPIYLESLKTYEHFAASDSLFSRASNKFGLRQLAGGRSVESLKQSVLKAAIPRNTKILEIGMTLPDAKLAQTVAVFLAEETVNLSRSVIADQDKEAIDAVETQRAQARATLDAANLAWSHFISEQPVQALQSQLDTQQQTRAQLERQLLATDLDAADYEDRSNRPGEPRREQAKDWLGEARARQTVLSKQLSDVDQSLERKERLFVERRAKLALLEDRRKDAQAAVNQLETRIRDIRGAAGYRGERLRIIDRGIVPERPSSPQPLLYSLAAFFFALLACLVYLSFAFSYSRRALPPSRIPEELAARRHDWHTRGTA
jgi:uncharacterized protein involved in exopolysaccharide biosynthesis